MKFKTYTGITWSFLELTGLLEDEDSRVCFEKVKKHLGLHPFHLTNLHTALNEILSSNLNSYDAELKGFLLAYKNPKLLTPLGEILYDTCFIHVDIEADFYIFRPEVGCSLKGIVNKKGLDHIGVLVHKAFNVSIPKPDDEEDWPGDNVDIGQEVRFVITKLDSTSRLPFIRGVLNEDYLQGCKLMDKPNNTCNTRVSFNYSSEDSAEIVDNNVSQAKSKSPKKKSFINCDSESTSEEERIQIKVQLSKGKRPKENQKRDSTISDVDAKTESKKHGKKSKEAKESTAKIIKMNAHSMNNQNEDDESDELPLIKRQSIKKAKVHDSQDDTADETGHNKSLKTPKKTPKKSANSKTINSRIKSEEFVAVDSSDSENTTEEEIPYITPVSRKQSPKKRRLTNSNSIADETLTTPIKKRLKKTKISDSESGDTFGIVKPEKIRTHDEDEEIYMAPTEMQIQKHKTPKRLNAHDNENPKVKSPRKNPRALHSEVQIDQVKREKLYSDSETNEGKDNKKKKTPKKHSENTKSNSSNYVHEDKTSVIIKKESTHSGPDTSDDNRKIKKVQKKHSDIKESTFNSNEKNVNITIKKEIIHSGSESNEEKYKTGKNKAPKSTSNSNENMNENDDNRKSKKKSKKQAMVPSDKIKIEPGFEDVVIKEEKIDDYEIEKIRVKEDTTNSGIQNSDDVTIESDVKHKKKKKSAEKEATVQGTKIKTEKVETHNTMEKKLTKKLINSDESSICIETDHEEDRKPGKSFPRKQQRKSRKPQTECDSGNVIIKVEDSVDS